MPNILSCVGEEEEKAEFEVDLIMITTLVKLKVVIFIGVSPSWFKAQDFDSCICRVFKSHRPSQSLGVARFIKCQ